MTALLSVLHHKKAKLYLLLVVSILYRGTYLRMIFHQGIVDTRWHMNSYSFLGYLYRFVHSPLAHDTESPQGSEVHKH